MQILNVKRCCMQRSSIHVIYITGHGAIKAHIEVVASRSTCEHDCAHSIGLVR